MWVGLLGLVVASAVQGEEPAESLHETPIETLGRAAFTVPPGYGRLAEVVVESEVHYLYFEDQLGTVRVVLVGPRGAAPRARTPLLLLSPDAYVVKREAVGAAPS
jgi:hypothetical protein